MSPTRRAVLRAGSTLSVALFAGCLGGGSPSDSPPRLTVTGTDADPDLPVRPSVEVTRDSATADHPPQLRATVTNTSSDVVHVGEGRAIVFSFVSDGSNSLMLLPTGGDYPARSGCWRLTDGIAVTAEYRIVRLAPGESTTRLVDLYGTPGGDGCLPTGEFRFESTYNATIGEDPAGGDGDSARWGFSVRLS